MSTPARIKLRQGPLNPQREVTRGRRVDAYFEFSAASFSSLSSLEVRVHMTRWIQSHLEKTTQAWRRWGECSVWGASRDSPNDALWDLDAFHGDEFLKLIQTAHILYLTAELGTETRITCTHTHTHIKTGTSDSAVKVTGLVSEEN